MFQVNSSEKGKKLKEFYFHNTLCTVCYVTMVLFFESLFINTTNYGRSSDQIDTLK